MLKFFRKILDFTKTEMLSLSRPFRKVLKTMGYENGLIADILNTSLSVVQGWFSEPSGIVG